jgi:hypothetical protein
VLGSGAAAGFGGEEPGGRRDDGSGNRALSLTFDEEDDMKKLSVVGRPGGQRRHDPSCCER